MSEMQQSTVATGKVLVKCVMLGDVLIMIMSGVVKQCYGLMKCIGNMVSTQLISG